MSDYITLDQLKGMTKNELECRWMDAIFPFDTANCRQCMTMHGDPSSACVHTELRKMAAPVWVASYDLHPALTEIYALRLYFRDLYPTNPPELDAIPTLEVPDAKPVAR